MRTLSQEEMELIAGGNITTHNQGSYEVYSGLFGGSYGFSWLWSDPFNYDVTGGYYYTDQGTGGSGTDGGITSICQSPDASQQQIYADQLAANFMRAVKKLDWNNKEYLAFVYRDASGTLRTSEVYAGGANVDVEIAKLGFAPAQIVGIMHNHPVYHYGNTQYEADTNRNPSDNDWATADNLVALGANPAHLDLYVIDTTGKLRSYEYADKAKYLHPKPTTSVGARVDPDLQPEYCPS